VKRKEMAAKRRKITEGKVSVKVRGNLAEEGETGGRGQETVFWWGGVAVVW
jgi:hypothetical protein